MIQSAVDCFREEGPAREKHGSCDEDAEKGHIVGGHCRGH